MFASLQFLQLTSQAPSPEPLTSCHSVQGDHSAHSTTPRGFLRCDLLGEAFPIPPVNGCDLPPRPLTSFLEGGMGGSTANGPALVLTGLTPRGHEKGCAEVRVAPEGKPELLKTCAGLEP